MAASVHVPQTLTEGRASPNTNCAICLDVCDMKAHTNTCFHQFCFDCLINWAKIKPVCPLCQKPFTAVVPPSFDNRENTSNIIYEIGNNHLHPIFGATAAGSGTRGTPQYQSRSNANDIFIPSLTITRNIPYQNYPPLIPFQDDFYNENPLFNNFDDPLDWNPRPNRNQRRRIAREAREGYDFRWSVYQEGFWATPIMTSQEVTPAYINENPTLRINYRPWLERDLMVLLNKKQQQVDHVLNTILEQLSRYHILSERFKQILFEYLGDKTNHFVHEFYNFMCSTYDMEDYDRIVVYNELVSINGNY